MRVQFRKKNRYTWAPVAEHDMKALDGMKPGEIHTVNFTKNRSTEEHNMFFSFITYVFENCQENFKTLEAFRKHLFLKIGYGEFDYLTLDDEIFMVFTPGSISFENCGQEKFHKTVMQPTAEYIMNQYGVNVEYWKKHIYKKIIICENPECDNIAAAGYHHIFPGTARRKICEKLGLKVKTCKTCHDRSHSHGEQEKMQKIWCAVRGTTREKALLLINT